MFQAALGELSAESRPFFDSVKPFLQAIIETATLASTTPQPGIKGGRPRKLLLYSLAHQIARAFIDILEQPLKSKPTGAFAEVLHLAIEFAGDGTEPSDLSNYIKSAVSEFA